MFSWYLYQKFDCNDYFNKKKPIFCSCYAGNIDFVESRHTSVGNKQKIFAVTMYSGIVTHSFEMLTMLRNDALMKNICCKWYFYPFITLKNCILGQSYRLLRICVSHVKEKTLEVTKNLWILLWKI